MAQIPDMKFKIKTVGNGGLERLNLAIRNARIKAKELEEAVYETQQALDDLEFIVERSKPEESIQPDEG